MFKIKNFILLLIIGLFALTLNAQEVAKGYGFLEVVDYEDKPIAKATLNSNSNGEQKTNKKGQLEKGLEFYLGSPYFSFSIKKSGYYDFTNYFELFSFLRGGVRNNKDKPLKIELLKIPKNSKEKKAIGDEQLKREFFGAARKGDTASVRKYLDFGLSPNLKTFDLRGVPATENEPIIIYAVKSGNGETVEEFLKAGVDVRQKNEPIKSILARYLENRPSYNKNSEFKLALQHYEDGVKSLIEAGADINAANKNSVTPLMIAVDKHYVSLVRLLVLEKVDANAQDDSGKTALMYLINNNKSHLWLEMANLLMQSGADLNIITNDTPYSKYNGNSCYTALTYAVQHSDKELVKFFIANGADVNLTCKGGNTALSYAKEINSYSGGEENKQIVKMLKAAGGI